MGRKADMLLFENLDEFGWGESLQRSDEGLPETADVLVHTIRLEESFVDQSAAMRRITLVNATITALAKLQNEA